MKNNQLRWGIVSTGLISHDFATAVAILPATDHQIIAVGAQNLTRAQEFAKLHNIPNAYQGYKPIATNPDVDVVYIGNLNTLHFEVAKLMLEHKKPVLCEKPLTLNLKQTKKLVEIARTNNVFLQEAVWSRMFPVYDEIRNQLARKAIGDIYNVIVSFGFNLSHVDRLNDLEKGGGTILDLGVYTLQFQQMVFQGQRPLDVKAVGKLNKYGSDESMSAILTYHDGRTAFVQTHALAELTNEAIIVGNKGIIRVPNFWAPTKLILPKETKEYPLPTPKFKMNHMNSAGLSYEAEQVRQCLMKGLTENPLITLDESLQLAELMDNLRRQVGVVYSADNE